jgi:ABC-type multidrug transport system ATPase subunit
LDKPEYVLWAEGIGRSFGKTVALKSASVWAEAGKVTTLMGRNGSGKTTLMRISAGVLRADYGVISYKGDARERHSLSRLARKGLMYIPQAQLMAPRYTVRTHFEALGVTFGSEGHEQAIEGMGVEPLLDQSCKTLSGGERMRVSLALAFARRPEVLLADEPLVGLTPRDQETFGQKLRDLAGQGVAVVTSGHDARVLLEISDVIIWSVAGTTHSLGAPAEALAHDQFRKEYLGPGWHPSSLEKPD